MQLLKVDVTGFRRFATRQSMVVEERLVAVVGRNEVGKSSFLDAITRLSNDKPIAEKNQSRYGEEALSIEGWYFLEEADRAAVSHLSGGEGIRWVRVHKPLAGRRRLTLDERPRRDQAARGRAKASLETFLTSPLLDPANFDPEDPWDPAALEAGLNVLAMDADQLSEEQIEAIRNLADRISGLSFDLRPEDAELSDEALEAREAQDRTNIEERDAVAQDLRESADDESTEHPASAATRILRGRLPAVLMFGEDARSLRAEYELVLEEDGVYPLALRNLCKLADLDLARLLDLIRVDSAKAQTAIKGANATLRERLDEAWGQSEVTCELQFDGTVLKIFVGGEGTHEIFAVTDRSEGMRTFITLLAFIHGSGADDPILLVDEAETHLHYDAQVDLIEVFASQRLASKIIYTTHSLGCLPADLITGVRAIDAETGGTSKTVPTLWGDSGALSLTPLLLGMGARLLALVVPRHAVLTEGTSDCILLPQLVRSLGLHDEPLTYRFMPGLSNASSAVLRAVDTEGGCVSFVLDGDEGADEIVRTLEEAAVEPAHIIQLSELAADLVTVEDLVDSELLAEAVNESMSRWRSVSAPIDAESLPATGKWAAIEEWAAGLDPVKPPPGKPQLAQTVVDLCMRAGNRRAHDDQHAEALRALSERLAAIHG